MSSPVRRAGGAQIIPRPDNWTPGPPFEWPTVERISVADVVQAVPTQQQPFTPVFEDSRNAAVLIVLHDGDDGAEVLLTRRSWDLTHHKGEVSFPGGRMDPGETPREAALREAWEEVGLLPDDVEVVGELGHLNTVVSRSYIIPVVARVGERPPLAAQTMEVERILWVPLNELLRTDTFREERWGILGTHRSIYFFELDDETIWGATSRMLVQLLSLVTKSELPHSPF
jgi:8-oxo-dGTP pyrophosphatase MutT (NUDIX family)